MDHFLEKIDTHTLSLLQQGDEKAFDTIFWKYNPRVFHFIHSLLYDKILAEDLTQKCISEDLGKTSGYQTGRRL